MDIILKILVAAGFIFFIIAVFGHWYSEEKKEKLLYDLEKRVKVLEDIENERF